MAFQNGYFGKWTKNVGFPEMQTMTITTNNASSRIRCPLILPCKSEQGLTIIKSVKANHN